LKGSNGAPHKETIRRIALANAIAYEGKAQTKPVLGKLLAHQPELKKRIKEMTPLINKVIREVNNLSLDEQMETVRKLWPEMLAKESEKVEEMKGLPPLPNVKRYRQVVTRFAPNPDCVLHLGSARAIILSHEYSRLYNGRFDCTMVVSFCGLRIQTQD
jgi:glutamyl-tRNA synthetase